MIFENVQKPMMKQVFMSAITAVVTSTVLLASDAEAGGVDIDDTRVSGANNDVNVGSAVINGSVGTINTGGSGGSSQVPSEIEFFNDPVTDIDNSDSNSFNPANTNTINPVSNVTANPHSNSTVTASPVNGGNNLHISNKYRDAATPPAQIGSVSGICMGTLGVGGTWAHYFGVSGHYSRYNKDCGSALNGRFLVETGFNHGDAVVSASGLETLRNTDEAVDGAVTDVLENYDSLTPHRKSNVSMVDLLKRSAPKNNGLE